jgi:hypothetical protein
MVTAFLGNDTDPAIRQKALHGLYLGTLQFFASPKRLRAVRLVADALMARRTLTGGEVKRIVLQAVDGNG